MKWATMDRQLLQQLSEIEEIPLSGFTVREGLTGAGVTILKGRNYFGSWRITAGSLVWVHANLSEPNHFEQNVDDAVRYTLLLILRNLEMMRGKQPAHVAAAG